MRKVLSILAVSCFLVSALIGTPTLSAQDQLPVKVDQSCINCHPDYQKQAGFFAGKFADVSTKGKAIQMTIDKEVEVVYFNDDTVLKNAPTFREIPKGESIRVKYANVDGKNVAKEVEVKKGIDVPPDKLASTEEVADLVAKGPDKGKYILLDSRPTNMYNEGHIPTAISMPFGAFDKLAESLLKDKDVLQIYYCAGFS